MKIGILSYPLNNNYGCYLQSYALLKYLREKGYDAEYIYRRHNKPSFLVYIKYAVMTLLKNIRHLKWDSLVMDYEQSYMLKKGYRLYPFFKDYVTPRTDAIYSSKVLKRKCLKYDAIIVGSDQVWRAELLSNIEDYYLSFIEKPGLIRVAYAASFGKDDPGYNERQRVKCGQALRHFKAVSVREDVGVDIIKRFGWEIDGCKVVIDPTMLLKKEHYKSFAKIDDTSKSVFGYILDQTNSKKEMLLYTATHFNCGYINFLADSADQNFAYPPVEDWIGQLSNANYVITDSFHGAVFSILFNVPFFVIVNSERGAARFETLLNSFNLKERAVSSIDEIKIRIDDEINWNEVNMLIEKKRSEAERFISEALSN